MFPVGRVEGIFNIECYYGTKATAQKHKNTSGIGFMKNAMSTLLCTSYTAFKVLRPARNPYCISDSPSFFGTSSSLCTRLRIILSYNLPVESSMHSGLQEDGALGSLVLPFDIRTSFWSFHCFGKWPLSKHVLSKSRMSWGFSRIIALRTSLGILSGPGAFPGSSLFAASLSSLIRNRGATSLG